MNKKELERVVYLRGYIDERFEAAAKRALICAIIGLVSAIIGLIGLEWAIIPATACLPFAFMSHGQLSELKCVKEIIELSLLIDSQE